jgi:excisionase family DNA binding protein
MTIRSLTTEEAAIRLGCERATVHTLIRTGRLPAFKLIRQWRIRESDLEAFMKG